MELTYNEMDITSLLEFKKKYGSFKRPVTMGLMKQVINDYNLSKRLSKFRFIYDNYIQLNPVAIDNDYIFKYEDLFYFAAEIIKADGSYTEVFRDFFKDFSKHKQLVDALESDEISPPNITIVQNYHTTINNTSETKNNLKGIIATIFLGLILYSGQEMVKPFINEASENVYSSVISDNYIAYGIISENEVNLSFEPKSESIICTLTKGDKVGILSIDNGYVKIEFNKDGKVNVGWIDKQFIITINN